MSDDFWGDISDDATARHREALLTNARIASADVWPVLAKAASKPDFENRREIVAARLDEVAEAVSGGVADDFIWVRASLEDSYIQDWDMLRQAEVKTAAEGEWHESIAGQQWDYSSGSIEATVETSGDSYSWSVMDNSIAPSESQSIGSGSADSLDAAKSAAESAMSSKTSVRRTAEGEKCGDKPGYVNSSTDADLTCDKDKGHDGNHTDHSNEANGEIVSWQPGSKAVASKKAATPATGYQCPECDQFRTVVSRDGDTDTLSCGHTVPAKDVEDGEYKDAPKTAASEYGAPTWCTKCFGATNTTPDNRCATCGEAKETPFVAQATASRLPFVRSSARNVPIEEVKVGDSIMVHNPDVGEYVPCEVLRIDYGKDPVIPGADAIRLWCKAPDGHEGYVTFGPTGVATVASLRTAMPEGDFKVVDQSGAEVKDFFNEDLAGSYANVLNDKGQDERGHAAPFSVKSAAVHTAGYPTLEEAVEVAKANTPIKIEVTRDPKGFLIYENNGTFTTYDEEPQAQGGFLPPAERAGTPVARVDLDGTVTHLASRRTAGVYDTAKQVLDQGFYAGGEQLDQFTASAIVQVMDALSPENKAKLDAMPLEKAVDIVWKLVNKTKGSKTTAAASGDTTDYSGGWARINARGVPEFWGDYVFADGSVLHLYRGPRNVCRFYDDQSNQVGPEQSNVAPAVAWAYANGALGQDGGDTGTDWGSMVQGSKTAGLVPPETIEKWRAAIAPLDTPDMREVYRSGNYPRADMTKDVDKRYRWDLFNFVVGNGRPISYDEVYVGNVNDTHIDTALRSIVAPLGTTASKTAAPLDERDNNDPRVVDAKLAIYDWAWGQFDAGAGLGEVVTRVVTDNVAQRNNFYPVPAQDLVRKAWDDYQFQAHVRRGSASNPYMPDDSNPYVPETESPLVPTAPQARTDGDGSAATKPAVPPMAPVARPADQPLPRR